MSTAFATSADALNEEVFMSAYLVALFAAAFSAACAFTLITTVKRLDSNEPGGK